MVATDTARIFLVDDHPIVRIGFRQVLEGAGRFAVVGEAGSGAEALEKIPAAEPDVAIVDISMGEMDGIELTRHLKRNYPSLRILIVSMHGDTYYAEKALEAGADGYVLKDNADSALVNAATRVLDGELYLCGDMQAKLGR